MFCVFDEIFGQKCIYCQQSFGLFKLVRNEIKSHLDSYQRLAIISKACLVLGETKVTLSVDDGS